MQGPPIRDSVLYEYASPGRQAAAAEYSNSLRNRRRLLLFVSVLAASLLVSMVYTFMRPAIYQSKASLLVTPPVVDERASELSNSQHAELERQVFLGRTMLQRTLDRLGREDSPDLDEITLQDLGEMLDARVLSDTNLIEMTATGPERERLPVILKAWLQACIDSHRESLASDSALESGDIERQLDEIRQKVERKREQLEQYRGKHDIVSMERNENRILKRLNGLTDSLNSANEEQVLARSRVNAIEMALSQGKPVGSDRSQTALVNLEDRLTAVQEQIKELEREFTPKYMSLDPDMAALARKKQLLEEKIRMKRREGGEIALAEAQQDLETARQAALSIQQQLDEEKQRVMDFTARFAEHEALKEELGLLEEQYRQVQQRQLQLQVDSRRQFAQIEVRAPPFLPAKPLYPDYMRDAGIGAAVSALLALISVLFYDFMTRPVRQTPAPGVQPVFVSTSQPEVPGPVAGQRLPYAQTAPPALGQLPRELSEDEVLALLRVADPHTRLLIACLLSGMSSEEVSMLRWGDINPDSNEMRLGEQPGRSLTITLPMRSALNSCMPADPAADLPVWPGQGPQALSANDIDALIACAAHDAGLTHPAEINAGTLVHTCLASLVRKGVKLSDLEKLCGKIAPTILAAYGVFSPPGAARSLQSIDRVYPALQVYFGEQDD